MDRAGQGARARAEEGGRREAPAARRGRKKGIEAVTALIVAAGSAGVFTSIVAIFNGWLKQGRRRSLKVSVKDGDKVKVLEVSTEGMSADDIRGVVERMT